ncbi:hypothetical protein GALMADRAFT_144954 [Galerina marginata CBS 339.88]|uniref:CxC5 like cysteine cluster associated with KDZ domain-containing protein n=1 Tax=Galerina marginata (strain CBS 339.88) TaxID=685588 RepID=A0A067SH72_GALM3|nr:hypothetical protein GALMADRAFT_144954 [Galerina marginata CBS 339.88]
MTPRFEPYPPPLIPRHRLRDTAAPAAKTTAKSAKADAKKAAADSLTLTQKILCDSGVPIAPPAKPIKESIQDNVSAYAFYYFLFVPNAPLAKPIEELGGDKISADIPTAPSVKPVEESVRDNISVPRNNTEDTPVVSAPNPVKSFIREQVTEVSDEDKDSKDNKVKDKGKARDLGGDKETSDSMTESDSDSEGQGKNESGENSDENSDKDSDEENGEESDEDKDKVESADAEDNNEDGGDGQDIVIQVDVDVAVEVAKSFATVSASATASAPAALALSASMVNTIEETPGDDMDVTLEDLQGASRITDYTIFVYDAIWTLLGSFDEITSVDGDEEITWETENNKPILRILLSNYTLPGVLSTNTGSSAVSGLSTTFGSGASLSVQSSASVQPQQSGPKPRHILSAELLEFARGLKYDKYHFEDLNKWIEKGGTLAKRKKVVVAVSTEYGPSNVLKSSKTAVPKKTSKANTAKSTRNRNSLEFWLVFMLCGCLDSYFGNLITLVYLLAHSALSFHFALLFWAMLSIPCVTASLPTAPFPDIDFKDFSNFIIGNFGQQISLPTVIMVLLSMTNNTELLSLHFKQDATGSKATSWIKCLARAIIDQLGDDKAETLFSGSELSMFTTATAKNSDVTSLSLKLSQFSQLLGLYPYNDKDKFMGTLQHTSHSEIQPALLICPKSSVCLTKGCGHCFFKQNTDTKNIPKVTLIKGTEVFKNVQLLSGVCNTCETIYYADHERTPAVEGTEATQFFLNSANYLKVGQKLWVDRQFSKAVMSGMYNLHTSASAWANYFNDTYGNDSVTLSRRQVWAAFVQESTRQASDLSGVDFIIQDVASIEEVTEKAFEILGNDGLIQPAKGHACAECSQPYRATSDATATGAPPDPNNTTALPDPNNILRIPRLYRQIQIIMLRIPLLHRQIQAIMLRMQFQ